MTQHSLFTPSAPYRIARFEDPETSHAAARAVAPKAGTWQSKVYQALKTSANGLTLQELTDLWPWAAESTIRTRCAELVDAGFVRDSGYKRTTRSGNQAIVWDVVA